MSIEFWHHHIGVSVPDLEASIEWYGRMLGFRLERRLELPQVPAKIAVLRNGPMHIELFEVQGAAALPEQRRVPDEDLKTHGNKHGCFAVADAIAVADELRARGADVVWAKKFPNGGANCFIRDNAGNLIEFMQAPRFPEATGTL
ncbi:MAG: VOC family protein [Steroidobacteraceae bacterium]